MSAQEFTVSHGGRLSENSVRKTVEDFEREFPWTDDATLEIHLAFAQAFAVFSSGLARRYADLGISVPRFNALRLLYHAAEKHLTITDLGVRLGVSTASVTRLIDGLARDGWVQRENAEVDKRVTHVRLTESGEVRLAALLPSALGIWSDLWAGLTTDEKRLFSHLSARLRMSLLSRFASEADLGLQEY